MSERPTPETDAAWQADKDTVFRVETSRRIERERDEAMELLASEKITRNHIIKRSVEVEQERDEAREALASREVVIAQQNVITDLILEREEARSVLQEIEAARWHTACELRRIATRALADLTIPTK